MTELSRRAVLRGGAAAAVGVGASWVLAGSSAHAGPAQVDAVLGPQPDTTVVAALDLHVSGAAAVRGVLREVDRRLRRLGDETMLALGASLFDRAGLAGLRPRQLVAMPAFTGDVLDPGRSHGDLLVSVGDAGGLRALDGLAGASVRWTLDGFRLGAGPGLSRNLFGFTEGHGNPHGGQVPNTVVVRAGQGEPAWAVGGTYQVVRIIRFAIELWDDDPADVQERIIGRRRDGRWLDGTRAAAQPVFDTDPAGHVTPLDSHVRLARGPLDMRPEMLRRGYSYQTEREEGLLFVAFQRDLERGFAGVQRRLAGEPLGRYTLAVGGGYFFLPRAGWTL